MPGYVTDALPLEEGKSLLTTFMDSFFVLEKTEVKEFLSPVSELAMRQATRRTVQIAENIFATSSEYLGVLIFDRTGEVVRVIDKKSGLPHSRVISISVDRGSGIWAATLNGVARLDLRSPVEVFDYRLGMTSDTFAIARHQDTLYLGTLNGVKILRRSSKPGKPGFVELIEDTGDVRDLLSVNGSLLLAGASQHAALIRNVLFRSSQTVWAIRLRILLTPPE